MSDLLPRLFFGFEPELGSRPTEFFARTQVNPYSMQGFTSFAWAMLPADRLIQLQSVSVLLMQAGTNAAVRVISVGVAVHLQDTTVASQQRTFLAQRHYSQDSPAAGHVIPVQGSGGFNVANGSAVMGAFTFPELHGVVIPPTVRLGTWVENVSIASQDGWVSTSVTGWSLPRGSLA